METFEELVSVIRRLREQCPWDSVQTHESLIPFLRSETEEVIQGITLLSESGDGRNLCEELGDVLMLLLLQALIAEEEGLFTVEDVLSGISDKMKFRHPRIFQPENGELTSLSWEELKAKEKNGRSGNPA
jgi:tetrapyrrole methylase family protein/MazG family protein